MSPRSALTEFSSTVVQGRNFWGSMPVSDYWALTKPEDDCSRESLLRDRLPACSWIPVFVSSYFTSSLVVFLMSLRTCLLPSSRWYQWYLKVRKMGIQEQQMQQKLKAAMWNKSCTQNSLRSMFLKWREIAKLTIIESHSLRQFPTRINTAYRLEPVDSYSAVRAGAGHHHPVTAWEDAQA